MNSTFIDLCVCTKLFGNDITYDLEDFSVKIAVVYFFRRDFRLFLVFTVKLTIYFAVPSHLLGYSQVYYWLLLHKNRDQ